MLLKNLMEEKQLDFNQPLLSVRKFSSTLPPSETKGRKKPDSSVPSRPPLPVYKSEIKSGPVRNPGTVPFIWEQTPGRPKDESKSQAKALANPSIAPKLPPGRILNGKQRSSDKVSEVKTVGQSQVETVPSSSENLRFSEKNASTCESCREEMEETGSYVIDNDDEAYVDALDTLSRTESFFLNCSISGVSGLDDPDLKPSGIFSADPQTRDLMMGRFLPAAKAMASEAPPHAIRRQPIAKEQPRQTKMIVSRDKQQPNYQYSPNSFLHNAQNKIWDENSSDDDDNVGHENSSVGVCGLFPQLCLKNSFCVLSPVPGIRMQGQRPASSVRRLHAKYLNARSCSETKNEHASCATNEQRLTRGHQKKELHEDKIQLKRVSNQITCDSWKSNGSPNRHFQINELLPSRNGLVPTAVNQGQQSLGFPEKDRTFRVNGIDSQRGPKSFQELLASDESKWESGSGSPVVEKTLYIDSVHTIESPNLYSSSSDTKEITDNQGDDFEVHPRNGEIEEISSVSSSVPESNQLNVVDEKAISQVKSLVLVDSNIKSSPDILASEKHSDGLKHDEHQDSIKSRSHKMVENGKIYLESQVCNKPYNLDGTQCLNLDHIALMKSNVGDTEVIGSERKSHVKSSKKENPDDMYRKHPLPPPLPKSPSESWLSRTLPTISARNSPSWSSPGTNNYTRCQPFKTPSEDPKWELIVKSSNVQHGHLRFSSELLEPIPEA